MSPLVGVLAVLVILVIVTCTVTLVQTSASAIDKRVLRFLRTDDQVASELRRALEAQRTAAPATFPVVLASPINQALTDVPVAFSMDNVVVSDQALVLLAFQTTAKENGIYRYQKDTRTLTLEPIQPGQGSLVHVYEGTVFRNHMFLTRKDASSGLNVFTSLAQSLLVNPYSDTTHGVLNFDSSDPIGMSFSAAPSFGTLVIRIAANGIRTIDPSESNAVILMHGTAEANVSTAIDGCIFRFFLVSDGTTATITFPAKEKLVKDGTSYSSLTSDARDSSVFLLFDATDDKWRMLQNDGWVAS